MCGRFAQIDPLPVLKNIFQIDIVTSEVEPRFNIAPSQEVPAVIQQDDKRRLGRLHWGLVPSWAKDTAGAAKCINARLETVKDKPAFRDAFKKRRCLVLASGFYEWRKKAVPKQPYYFTLPSNGPIAFAGLWERWIRGDGSLHHSCTIITTVASQSVAPVHNRMPFILQPESLSDWLDPGNRDVAKLETLLRQGHVERLRSYAVSHLVNNVANDSADCIVALKNTEVKELRR